MIGFYFIYNNQKGRSTSLTEYIYVFVISICIKVTHTMYGTGLVLMA